MDRLSCKINEPIATRRTFYFVAVDAADLKSRLIGTDLGAVTVRITKAGGLGVAPAAGVVYELDPVNLKGIFMWQAAIGDVDTRGRLIVKITAVAGGGGKTMVPVELDVEIGPGNLLEAILEGANQFDGNGEAGVTDVTVAGALREILGYASGPAQGLNGPTTVIKSRGGGRNRIVATQANGNRGITSRDNS